MSRIEFILLFLPSFIGVFWSYLDIDTPELIGVEFYHQN